MYEVDKLRVQNQTIETAAGVDSYWVPVNTPWSQLQVPHRGAAFNNTGSATRSLTHQRQTVIYTYLYAQLHSLYKFIIRLRQKQKKQTFFFLLPVIIQPLLLLHQYCSIAISNILKIFCAFVHFIKNFFFSMIDHLPVYCTHACIYMYKKLQVIFDMLWFWNVDNHKQLLLNPHFFTTFGVDTNRFYWKHVLKTNKKHFHFNNIHILLPTIFSMKSSDIFHSKTDKQIFWQ